MKKNHLLRIAREERSWSIKYCARRIGINAKSYRLWEVGEHEPALFYLRKLCQLFACGPAELGYRLYPPIPEPAEIDENTSMLALDHLQEPPETAFDPGEHTAVEETALNPSEHPTPATTTFDPATEHDLHPWKNTLLMAARKRRGWTQLELSQRIGVNYTSCSQWENNRALPTLANLFALCQAFNCLPAELGYPIEPPISPSSSEEEPYL